MALPPTGYRKPTPSAASTVAPRRPLPEDRGNEARMPYPLGAWAGDKFVFKSPEAEKQWQADSFLQGSHHLLWMKGRRLRPDENTLAGMGLPRSDDIYRGPDGHHYQTTPMSREDPHMAMLRAAHLATEPAQGSATAMGQRASLKALPQAMATMAQGARVEARPPAANDNRTAANENDLTIYTGAPEISSGSLPATSSPPPNVDGTERSAFNSLSHDGKGGPIGRVETVGLTIPAGSSPEQSIIQLWDWLNRGRNNEGEACPEPDCDEVHSQCSAMCLDIVVDDPDKLPGTGHDKKGRYRRCVRECMEAHGCFDY